MNVQIGDSCWKVYAEGVSSRDVTEAIINAISESIKTGMPAHDMVDSALREHVGMDLHAPSDVVRPGDVVAIPGGMTTSVGESGGFPKRAFLEIVNNLGIERELLRAAGAPKEFQLEEYLENGGNIPTVVGALDKVVDDLRARLGEVLELVTNDGCNSVSEGISDLMKAIDDSENPLRIINLRTIREILHNLGIQEEVEADMGDTLDGLFTETEKVDEILFWLANKTHTMMEDIQEAGYSGSLYDILQNMKQEFVPDRIRCFVDPDDLAETVVSMGIGQDIYTVLGESGTWDGKSESIRTAIQHATTRGVVHYALDEILRRVVFQKATDQETKQRLRDLHQRVLGEDPPDIPEKDLITRMLNILGPVPEF